MLKRIIIFFAGLIITSALVVLGVSLFQKTTFETKTRIAIKIENPALAGSLDSILDNAQVIAGSVKTYDKLLETDSRVSTQVYKENEQLWKDTLKIERINNSSILEVSINNDTSEESQKIARNFIPVFMSELSRFYNIKTEARAWVFEGPVTLEKRPFTSKQVAYWSLLVGAILGLILAWFFGKERDLPLFQREIAKLQEDLASIRKPAAPQPVEKIDPFEENFSEKVSPETESEPKKEPTIIVPAISDSTKTNAAPANLPVAGDDIVKMFGAVKSDGYTLASPKEVSSLKKEEKPALYKEATPEEVKARLNKLLGGA